MKLASLVIIAFAVFPVYAASGKCPLVNCDCGSISDAQWGKECRDYEKKLIKACVANKGKPTSYCRVQGLDAFPVALSVKVKQHTPVDKAGVKELKNQIESLTWSAEQDLKMAVGLEELTDYGQSVTQRKGLEKALAKIHQLHHQIAQSWIALGETDEAIDHWESVAKAARRSESDELRDIEPLWTAWQSKLVAKDKERAVQLLAMRRLRNLGNAMERLADAHSRSRQVEKAAEYWQRAADLSERLATWQQEVKGKPAFVRYFRNQAAARWNKAALFWRQAATDERADFARHEAERILSGTDQKSIAEL